MNEHLKQHRSIDPEVFTWQQRQESLRVRARYIIFMLMNSETPLIFMLMNSETPPQTFADCREAAARGYGEDLHLDDEAYFDELKKEDHE
jgi:hypothetical protein